MSILKKYGSTQDYIRERLAISHEEAENLQALSHGTVVIAESQTKGKGTNGRKWRASPRRKLNFFSSS